MPFLTETRIGNVVRLAWNQADTGNSPLTSYTISRGTSSNNEVFLATIPGTQKTYTDTTATDATQTYYYKVVANNAIGSSCANNEIAAPYIGDTCSGIVIHRNLPTHPAVSEPPGTNQLMFKMKVGNLLTLPPSSRWRLVWNSAATPDEQFYVGMTTDNSATPVVSFEYGTIQTLSVVVVGIPQENPLGTPEAGSNYNADGTITILIDKSKVGSPAPGDLLGAVNGRTFNTGDTPPETLERSTALVDHTFVKGNIDNAFPAATYTVTGNTICSAGNIEPVSAVSRKSHGTVGDFDVDLPLIGQPGIECRTGGTNGDHKVVITFAVPVTVNNVTVTPAPGKTASLTATNGFTTANSQVTVNLTNVSNAQTLSINLIGVTGGANSGNVAIPMSILLGDVTASGDVDSGDVSLVRQQTLQPVTFANFREDVTASGDIDSGDVSIVLQQTLTSLH
jgi:hypothetical protein